MPPYLRPSARDLFLPVCISLFLALLGWQLTTRYVQANRLTPEMRMALTALRANDRDNARALFEKMLANRPDAAPEIYVQICRLCSQTEQWTLLEEYSQRGLQASKYASEPLRAALSAHRAIALAETETERPQRKALMAAEDAVLHAPRSPEALNLLGYLLADNNLNLHRAHALITQALKQIQEMPESVEKQSMLAATLDSYGWVLYRQKKYPEAVATLRQAICSLPDMELPGSAQKVMYYHLGAAYRQVGRVEDARNALQVALYYDANYAPAKKELAALPAVPTSAPLARPQTAAAAASDS